MNATKARLSAIWQKALGFWNKQTKRNQMFLAAAMVLVPLALIAATLFLFKMRQPEYKPLFTGLEANDANAIIEALKKEGVDYKLGENGAAISIPSEMVYEKRLSFAAQGLPNRGTVGYELFDTTKLGVTDFTQKINLVRAKEGELSRTIMGLDSVDQARVMIVEPEPSLFIDKEDKPTASVALKMKQGMHLEQDQVRGIVHLVASSIKGLDPKSITVVNEKGEILSDFDEREKMREKYQLTELQMKYKKALEDSYKEKILTSLSKVLGTDNVVVTVSADLNFDKESSENETYEPLKGSEKGIPRSEQAISEKYLGTGAVPEIGVPGTTSNIPGYKGLAEGNAEYNRTEQTTNYEITRLTTKTETAFGKMEKLSVAVILNEAIPQYAEVEAESQIPYAQQKIKDIKDNVCKAANLGTVAACTDNVSVISVRFFDDQIDLRAEMEAQKKWERIMRMVRIGLPIGALFVVLLLGLLGLRKAVVQEPIPEEIEEEEGLEEPVPVEELLVPELSDEQRLRERMKEEVLRMIHDDPEGAALIVRSWLFDEE